MNFALLPVLIGLTVGVATIIIFSVIFDDTPVRTSTQVIPQDRAPPPPIPLAIIVCGDEDNPTHSTNSPDNPLTLIRGDINGVDVPLCIFSSSSASILYQFHANTHITPVPAGIHATFDYPVISTHPHKGSGTGQSIQRDSNDVVHYSGKMMKNKLHLWADNTTDPAIEYIMIEAQEMTHDWYGYDVYVTIR